MLDFHPQNFGKNRGSLYFSFMNYLQYINGHWGMESIFLISANWILNNGASFVFIASQSMEAKNMIQIIINGEMISVI